MVTRGRTAGLTKWSLVMFFVFVSATKEMQISMKMIVSRKGKQFLTFCGASFRGASFHGVCDVCACDVCLCGVSLRAFCGAFSCVHVPRATFCRLLSSCPSATVFA